MWERISAISTQWHTAQCSVEKWKIYCHWKFFSSNQLFSNFFSKKVIFTKVLPKMCGMAVNFHNSIHEKFWSLGLFSIAQQFHLCLHQHYQFFSVLVSNIRHSMDYSMSLIYVQPVTCWILILEKKTSVNNQNIWWFHGIRNNLWVVKEDKYLDVTSA